MSAEDEAIRSDYVDMFQDEAIVEADDNDEEQRRERRRSKDRKQRKRSSKERKERSSGRKMLRDGMRRFTRREEPETDRKRSKQRRDKIKDDLYDRKEYYSMDMDEQPIMCGTHQDGDFCFALDKDYEHGVATRGTTPDVGVKPLDENEEVYVVKQRYGYFSILFSLVQTIVLGLMMWQCGIAPLNINPMFGPYPDALSEWGGKNSVLIVEDGEWWRLGTPIFLHAGVIHLVCNVGVQLELGVLFEREWTSFIYLIIYLTSAVGSSVFSVIAMPDAVSVGSSGAVMGLFGGKLAEVICRACEKSDTAQQKVGHQVRKEQCVGVTCSVLVVGACSFIPYVDWAAHLGGLLAGLFVGLMIFSVHLEHYCFRLFWFLAGAGLTLGFFIPCVELMYSGEIPMAEELRDVCGYYSQYFDDYECNCMREEYLANGAWKQYIYGGGDDAVDNGDGGDGQRNLLAIIAQHYGFR